MVQRRQCEDRAERDVKMLALKIRVIGPQAKEMLAATSSWNQGRNGFPPELPERMALPAL